MPTLKLLTEKELRQAVQLDLQAIECIENAFASLSGGQVVMPPIMSMTIEQSNGDVDVKTAYVPGIESFAIKISPGFFDNPKLGLPSTSGLMVLFAVKTGMVEAILLDNGYLTDVRTAAAGAVAARHLARKDAKCACVIGAGQQSRLQLEALCLVRPIEKAVIWARNSEKAKTAALQLSDSLSITVESQENLENAVKSADVILTTTPSTQPLVKADWLKPGQHITAMGSDQSHKVELEPQCLALATRYVADRRSQTEVLGELHHAIKAGVFSPEDQVFELGDIVAGSSSARLADDEITICDLTGTGVQDTAIATFAKQRADDSSVGLMIEA